MWELNFIWDYPTLLKGDYNSSTVIIDSALLFFILINHLMDVDYYEFLIS